MSQYRVNDSQQYYLRYSLHRCLSLMLLVDHFAKHCGNFWLMTYIILGILFDTQCSTFYLDLLDSARRPGNEGSISLLSKVPSLNKMCHINAFHSITTRVILSDILIYICFLQYPLSIPTYRCRYIDQQAPCSLILQGKFKNYISVDKAIKTQPHIYISICV